MLQLSPSSVQLPRSHEGRASGQPFQPVSDLLRILYYALCRIHHDCLHQWELLPNWELFPPDYATSTKHKASQRVRDISSKLSLARPKVDKDDETIHHIFRSSLRNGPPFALTSPANSEGFHQHEDQHPTPGRRSSSSCIGCLIAHSNYECHAWYGCRFSEGWVYSSVGFHFQGKTRRTHTTSNSRTTSGRDRS